MDGRSISLLDHFSIHLQKFAIHLWIITIGGNYLFNTVYHEFPTVFKYGLGGIFGHRHSFLDVDSNFISPKIDNGQIVQDIPSHSKAQDQRTKKYPTPTCPCKEWPYIISAKE